MGTPSAGVPFEPWVAATAASRPPVRDLLTTRVRGLGAASRDGPSPIAPRTSPRSPGALGLERLHVVGWSGGGPHALACAALLPGLVAIGCDDRRASPRGARPVSTGWTAWPRRIARSSAQRSVREPALEPFLGTAARGMREQRADTIVEALGGLVTEVDRQALDGPLAGLPRQS